MLCAALCSPLASPHRAVLGSSLPVLSVLAPRRSLARSPHATSTRRQQKPHTTTLRLDWEAES